jgi:hypothetical protein
MKALDEELRTAERVARAAGDVERMTAPFRDAVGRVFGRATGRRSTPDDDDVATAA